MISVFIREIAEKSMKLPMCLNECSDSKIICFHDLCLNSNKLNYQSSKTMWQCFSYSKILASERSVAELFYGYQHKIPVTVTFV